MVRMFVSFENARSALLAVPLHPADTVRVGAKCSDVGAEGARNTPSPENQRIRFNLVPGVLYGQHTLPAEERRNIYHSLMNGGRILKTHFVSFALIRAPAHVIFQAAPDSPDQKLISRIVIISWQIAYVYHRNDYD